jgi:hypothetical protein
MSTLPVVVTARNASGLTTTANAVMNVTDAPAANAIPMSFNDPLFTGMTAKTSMATLGNGQNLSNASWDLPSSDINVICNGNNKLTKVRCRSRECIRLAGAGSHTYDQCWFEARGTQPDDHADCIQTYPATTGSIILKNSYLRGDNSTHCGLFVADGWQGSVTVQNTIFHGQCFGLRIFSDSGPITMAFKDVFFVGPFQSTQYEIRRTPAPMTITQWENVRNATIVNGLLIPGALLPKPTV